MTMKLTILEALLGHNGIFCDLILTPASNKLLYLKDTEQTVVIITVSGKPVRIHRTTESKVLASVSEANI